MRRSIIFLLLFFGCFVGTARGQTGVINLSVTPTPINIVVNVSCNYVVIQENSAAPGNAFTITLPGGSTGITYAAGTKFIFSANSGGFINGQTIGAITVPTGTVSFVGIESVAVPTIPASVKTSGGGGSGAVSPGTNPVIPFYNILGVNPSVGPSNVSVIGAGLNGLAVPGSLTVGSSGNPGQITGVLQSSGCTAPGAGLINLFIGDSVTGLPLVGSGTTPCEPIAVQGYAGSFPSLTVSGNVSTATLSATGQITSTETTGTAPFVVASTTNVPNLNASSLNGANFSAPGPIGGVTPSTGAFTTLTGNFPSGFATASINGTIYIDGVTNTLPSAINNASSGTTIYVPPGSYSISSGITITASNVHVLCSGINATKIIYTGSTLSALVTVGTSNSGSANQYNDSINGCTFSGNSSVTNGLYVEGVHHSDFSNNSWINVTGAGIRTSFAVEDNFDLEHTSSNEQAFAVQPTNCIYLDGPNSAHETTDASMKGDICEGVSGDGWYLNITSNAQIRGGTSEGNNRGLNATANTIRLAIHSSDFESNTTEDFLDNGAFDSYYDVVAASTVGCHLGSTANYIYLFQGTLLNPSFHCQQDSGSYDIMYNDYYGAQQPTLNAVYDSAVQTLTNKTLTSPVVTGPVLNGVAITSWPNPDLIASGEVPAFTSTGVVFQWTPAQTVTITALEYSAGLVPGSGCSTAPVINIGGITASNLTMTNNTTHGIITGLTIGAMAGTLSSIEIQTADSGCSTPWTNVTLIAHYITTL
jgi:hypothetical protein